MGRHAPRIPQFIASDRARKFNADLYRSGYGKLDGTLHPAQQTCTVATKHLRSIYLNRQLLMKWRASFGNYRGWSRCGRIALQAAA
jgi:hypothetical protein